MRITPSLFLLASWEGGAQKCALASVLFLWFFFFFTPPWWSGAFAVSCAHRGKEGPARKEAQAISNPSALTIFFGLGARFFISFLACFDFLLKEPRRLRVFCRVCAVAEEKREKAPTMRPPLARQKETVSGILKTQMSCRRTIERKKYPLCAPTRRLCL